MAEEREAERRPPDLLEVAEEDPYGMEEGAQRASGYRRARRAFFVDPSSMDVPRQGRRSCRWRYHRHDRGRGLGASSGLGRHKHARLARR